jgi:hypothetical protein
MENSDSKLLSRSIFIGEGGSNARIRFILDCLEPESKEILIPGESQSIYSLAVSPSGSKIAWGARGGKSGNKGGEVSFRPLHDHSEPIKLGRHIGGCYGITFIGEEILISGGMDKRLKAWDLKKHSLITEFDTEGEVIAITALSHNLVATVIKKDGSGQLVLWDLDRITPRYHGPQFHLPKVYALMNIIFSNKDLNLYHPSGQGKLCSYKIIGDEVKFFENSRHSGDFYAFDYCPDLGLVTVGNQDRMIKIGGLDGPVLEKQSPEKILSVLVIPRKNILLFDENKILHVCNLKEDELQILHQKKEVNARSVRKLPEKALSKIVWEEKLKIRKQLLDESKNELKNEDWAKLELIVNELIKNGFEPDALITLVQMAERRNQPLALLNALYGLNKILPDEPFPVEARYQLGVQLEVLGEYQEALNKYLQVNDFMPEFKDISMRIRLLDGKSLPEHIKRPLRQDIKKDIENIKNFLDRCNILEKKFDDRFIYAESKALIRFPEKLSLDEIHDILKKSESFCRDGTAEIWEKKEGCIFSGIENKSVNWIEIRVDSESAPEICQAAMTCLVIHNEGQNTIIESYLTFDAKPYIDPHLSFEEHNKIVFQIYERMHDDKEELDWFRIIQGMIPNCLKNAINTKETKMQDSEIPIDKFTI